MDKQPRTVKRATKAQMKKAKKEMMKIIKKTYPNLDIDFDLVDLAK